MLSSHTAVTLLPLLHVLAAHSLDRGPRLSDEARLLDPRVWTPRGAAREAAGGIGADAGADREPAGAWTPAKTRCVDERSIVSPTSCVLAAIARSCSRLSGSTLRS